MAFTPQGTGFPSIPPVSGLLSNTTARNYDLGQLFMDTRGNAFRYVQANEALAAGDVVTHIAEGAWDSGIVTDGAGASGDEKLHLDTITTARAANYYKGYYVTQATAAAKGQAYQIKEHDSFAASGEQDIKLYDPLAEVFSDNGALRIFNPYLVELVDADTEMIRGVAVTTIAAASYGFIQVGGFCPHVKVGHSTSAAIVVNEPLVPVAANPGACQGFAGTTEPDILEVGLSPLIALRASNANTTGFCPAIFRRIC